MIWWRVLLLLLALSSSTVNVVFNASILRYVAQYGNVYVIQLYCAILNRNFFSINYYQKLQILHTYISLKYWCIFMSNMTSLPFLLLTSYNNPFLNPLVVLEIDFLQDDATEKLYYCTLVKTLILFRILITCKSFNVFTGQIQIIEERMFILWAF